MRTIATLATILIMFLAPVALANDHGEPGPDAHVALLAEADAGEDHYYILEDHGAFLVYRETNGILAGGVDGSGVQPAWFCLDGETVVYIYEDDDCEAGVKTAPDEQVTNTLIIHEIEELLPEPAHELIEEIEHEIEELGL